MKDFPFPLTGCGATCVSCMWAPLVRNRDFYEERAYVPHAASQLLITSWPSALRTRRIIGWDGVPALAFTLSRTVISAVARWPCVRQSSRVEIAGYRREHGQLPWVSRTWRPHANRCSGRLTRQALARAVTSRNSATRILSGAERRQRSGFY